MGAHSNFLNCRRVSPKRAIHVSEKCGYGFTLVELLVVIAIIGILVALLLPAVQAAREAARRAKCQNNMKNVALAVLNYESASKKFPPGFVSQPLYVEAWGWAVFTLPYLEEQAVYDQLRPSDTFVQPVDPNNKGKRNLADALGSAKAGNVQDLAALQAPIATFHCASDATPDLVPCADATGACAASDHPVRTTDNEIWERSFRGTYAPGTFLPPASNYMGNRGMIDAGCDGSGSGTTASPWVANQPRCNSNGVFFGNSKVKIGQITDGTGKTFMIGERSKYCLVGTWLGARNPVESEIHSSLWTLGHVANKNSVPNYAETGAYETCPEGFSSSHKGGVFFAFCDGSVHFISDDIQSNANGNSKTCWVKHPDPAQQDQNCVASSTKPTGTTSIGVYQRLAWRDDGVPIEDTSF